MQHWCHSTPDSIVCVMWLLQVTLEEQMICGALQTLNEEACEDVMEETEEEAEAPCKVTSLGPSSELGESSVTINFRTRSGDKDENALVDIHRMKDLIWDAVHYFFTHTWWHSLLLPVSLPLTPLILSLLILIILI